MLILRNSAGNGLYGHYDKFTETLEVNANFAKGFEVANEPETIPANALLLAIATMHEFVHYGRDVNNLISFINEFKAG